MSAHGYDEGHTVAGWAGTAVAAVGAAVIGLGVCGWTPGMAVGAAVVAAAGVLTWALHLAGWGKGPGSRPKAYWPMGARDHTARGGHAECLGCRMAGRRPAATAAAVAATATAAAAAAEGPR
ncbi:HGxxPAAW family protein [Streptomyces racemochromogenes]|uniref:HGxxPAAW family protein n=1 Tax=Streptomyces racemochromogenes TaxID=67353 RepID=A0ABW7PJ23_9ACTN